MFHRGSIFMRIIGGLVILALLVALGGAIFRMGFTQGVAFSGVKEGVGFARGFDGFENFHHFRMMPHSGFFPFVGLLGIFLVGMFIVGILGVIFRPRCWGPMGYGPIGHSMGAHPHWHGQMPCGCPLAEEIGKVEATPPEPDKS